MIHWLRLPIALMAALGLAAASAAAMPADHARWLSDFQQLKAALEERSPSLAWQGSPQSGVNLPALNRSTLEQLAVARDEDGAREALRRFIAGLHDGHLSELPMLAVARAPASEPEQPDLDADDPGTGCAVLGFESNARVGFSLPFNRLRGFKLINDGLSQPFRTATMPAPDGGQIAILRIQNFVPNAFPVVCHEAWLELQRRGADFTWHDVREAAQARWLADLATRLRELKQEGARAIIIDVGDDSGGNDSGDWVARMLTDREVVSSRLLVTTSASGVAYLDQQIADLEEALSHARGAAERHALQLTRDAFRARKSEAARTHCDLSWVWTEQRPWNPSACNNLVQAGFASGPLASTPPGHIGESAALALFWPTQVASYRGAWSGAVYVLADQKTYSSAEMFTAIMQDNAAGVIVGRRTGRDGCGFMTESEPLELTNLRLRFRIPNCVRLRGNGDNEVAGIAPNISIEPTEGESDPARAARTFAAIVADLSAPRGVSRR